MNRHLLVALSFLAAGLVSRACGPYYPNAYLFWDSLYTITASDGSLFAEELKRILGEPGSEAEPGDLEGWDQTEKADVTDLRKCLIGDLGQPVKVVAPIVQQYRALRDDIDARTFLPVVDEDDFSEPRPEMLYDLEPYAPLLAKLPAEFSLYLKGAVAYRAYDLSQARTYWSKLLELPPAQRRYRTTWVWFMLGKSFLSLDEHAQAARCFANLREAAKDGFEDSLRLAVASLGWEARARYFLDEPVTPYHLYAAMYRRGNPVDAGRAVESIRFITANLVNRDSPAAIQAVAADPLAGRFLTAWLVAFPGDDGNLDASFLRQLRQQLVPGAPVPGAGRLAAIAYSLGDFEETQAWLNLADPATPSARWVRAKLLLRNGDPAGYLKLLLDIDAMPAEAFDRDCLDRQRLQVELGIALLNQGHHSRALGRFLEGDAWVDAAYVAERVLTVDELAAFLAEREKLPLPRTPADREAWRQLDKPEGGLSHLLARRLARQGDFVRAGLYAPVEFQVILAALATHHQRAADRSLPVRERASALLAAANLTRDQGMEIMGSELAPDWYHLGGGLDPDLGIEERLATVALAAERVRVQRHDVKPNLRFHYRYLAAELAWTAASMLPDNDLLTARALYDGGGFIKARDPEAADRFYKALVNRCGGLPIGIAANRLRWFPETFDNSPAN